MGVFGWNGREQYILLQEGSLICPPRNLIIFYQRETKKCFGDQTLAISEGSLSSEFDSNHLQQSGEEVYDPSYYGQFSQSNPSEDDNNPYQNFIVQLM